MHRVFLALTAAALVGCDRPAPITLPREDPKAQKEAFNGFQASGTPLPLRAEAEPSVSTPAEQPTPIPAPALAPAAQAAIEDYAKAMHDFRSDPAVRPSENPDLNAVQSLNSAIIGHMQQIEDAQDRARAAMNPQQRKAWATKKKEIDEGD